MPMTAPKISEIEKLTPLQNYKMDQLTVGPNLAGLPHITIPVGEELPPGIMFIALRSNVLTPPSCRDRRLQQNRGIDLLRA